MYIIVATWYGPDQEPFKWEYFNSAFDKADIFNMYEELKDVYDHKVVSSTSTYRMFSDGTRVVLNLGIVQNLLSNRKDVIDVKPRQLTSEH
jgi:hypothetical protein